MTFSSKRRKAFHRLSLFLFRWKSFRTPLPMTGWSALCPVEADRCLRLWAASPRHFPAPHVRVMMASGGCNFSIAIRKRNSSRTGTGAALIAGWIGYFLMKGSKLKRFAIFRWNACVAKQLKEKFGACIENPNSALYTLDTTCRLKKPYIHITELPGMSADSCVFDLFKIMKMCFQLITDILITKLIM